MWLDSLRILFEFNRDSTMEPRRLGSYRRAFLKELVNFILAKSLLNELTISLNDGSLGSSNDEERSEMRYVV